MHIKNFKKLELSENVNTIPKTILEGISEDIDIINYYPDPDGHELKQAIAKHNKIHENNVFIGNGSDEVILATLIGLGIINQKVAVPCKTFMGYYFSGIFLKNEIIEINLKDYGINIDTCYTIVKSEQIAAIFICNPHNPFGTLIPRSDLLQLVRLCEERGVYCVIDEAYIEFVSQDFDLTQYVNDFNYLIVIRTFSKAYGLAGIRCGYACSSPTVISKMHSVKKILPFSVNRIALKAATLMLNDQNFLNATIQNNNSVKTWFEKQLDSLGVEYVKSNTNFISICVVDSKRVVSLFYDNSILVKDLRSMGIYDFVRITIGTKHDMEQVIKIIYTHKDCFIKTNN